MDTLRSEISLQLPNDFNFETIQSEVLESVVPTERPEVLLSDNSILFNNLFKKLAEQFTQSTPNITKMDMLRNTIVLNTDSFTSDELQHQLEYDQFMNEIWIGIVITLVVISLVFCICSCFLYHQFRTWKRNFRNSMQHRSDLESAKLNPELDVDPVPEYTLVSGLPSYDAALELLQKTPNSCIIVYPSLFNVFQKDEKTPQPKSAEEQPTFSIPSYDEAMGSESQLKKELS